ncbi:MAG: DUF4302 domain-containing protein [Cyclobacteriaceae bacterium]|nr:DUF4302 domain-containing protein [Cyclobacteriaceae bacterium]
MLRSIIALLMLLFVAVSCSEDNTDLPPVEERVKEAVEGLKSDLTAPANGWRLEYQPTEESGTFLILMKFTPDGNVNIKSDVPDNSGEFFDHTISYRIDNALGLELILETYGVFHYLFELDQATFGAEFEFLFKEKEDDGLVFESISDTSNPTQLVFTPAGANDENEFARDITANLGKFDLANPQIFGTINPTQQVILTDKNISIFWTIDLTKRNLIAEFAGKGTTRDEVLANSRITLNHFSKFTLSNGQITLLEPLSFVFNGQSNNITSLTLSDFSFSGPDLCASGVNNIEPLYTGQTPGVGTTTIVNTMLSNRGIDFGKTVYTVNALFIFDDQGNSLQETGSIGTKLLGTSGFVLFYGVQLNDPSIPIYSVGFIMEDGEIYVREYQPTTTAVNLFQINLLDQYYYSATPPAGTETALKEITDEIFAGGEFYAFDLPGNGVQVFRLYNPCNKYEFFLVP